MKKTFWGNAFVYAGFFLIAVPMQVYGQSLGLGDAGNKLMSEVEKVFPYVAGIIFLFVGFKNLGHFTEGDGDVWKGIKNLAFYIFAVLCVVGVYKFVKSQSL